MGASFRTCPGRRQRRLCTPWYAACLLLALLATETTSATPDQTGRSSIRQRKLSKEEQHENQERDLLTDIVISFSEDDPNLVPATRATNNNGQNLALTEERIIGGATVNAGKYPFFVQWNRGCGGTLIHKDLVLTAAHCYVEGGKMNTVWVGATTTGQARQRTIVEYFVHPQYNSAQEAYDFLILRLDEEVRGSIQPVVLNTYPNNNREPYNGEALTVIGFGVTDYAAGYQSDKLLAADVTYIADCATSSSYGAGIIQDEVSYDKSS